MPSVSNVKFFSSGGFAGEGVFAPTDREPVVFVTLDTAVFSLDAFDELPDVLLDGD
jgi:hypothetical protein